MLLQYLQFRQTNTAKYIKKFCHNIELVCIVLMPQQRLHHQSYRDISSNHEPVELYRLVLSHSSYSSYELHRLNIKVMKGNNPATAKCHVLTYNFSVKLSLNTKLILDALNQVSNINIKFNSCIQVPSNIQLVKQLRQI